MQCSSVQFMAAAAAAMGMSFTVSSSVARLSAAAAAAAAAAVETVHKTFLSKTLKNGPNKGIRNIFLFNFLI